MVGSIYGRIDFVVGLIFWSIWIYGRIDFVAGWFCGRMDFMVGTIYGRINLWSVEFVVGSFFFEGKTEESQLRIDIVVAAG